MRRGPAVFLLILLLVASAYGAQRALVIGWDRVTHFAPATTQAAKPTIGPPAVAARLVVIIADGLRPDDALLMPSVDWLSRQGATLRATVPEPGYPYPGAATLLTGAPPTVHGVLLEPTGSLLTDSLPQAAQRSRLKSAGVGTTQLGRVVAPLFDGNWVSTTNQDVMADEIRRLLGPSGPRLVLIQLPLIAEDGRSLRPELPAYMDLLGELNAQLVRITEQLDLKSTAVIVTGTVLPAAADPEGRIPLIMAGAGVKPGYHGEASLMDVAPTAAALLGVPTPLESQGRPLVEALAVAERPAGVIAEQYMATRRTYTDAALRALGSNGVTQDPPTDPAQVQSYIRTLQQQVTDAKFVAWKGGLMQRLPWVGGAILILLVYLIAAWRQPFGGAVLWGMLTYGLTFHIIFFSMGGRYSAQMASLGRFDRTALMRLSFEVAVAMMLACFVMGLLLSRKRFRLTPYLSGSALHMALSVMAGLLIPLLIAMAIIGWEMPLAMPAPGYLVWYFITVLQLVLIGYLAPLWAILTVKSTRFATAMWPVGEPGDPERNADKVVRIGALKRSARHKA